MTNAYADLTTLRSESWINITKTDEDTRLRTQLEQVSRFIDDLTGRFFYCWEGAMYFNGAGTTIYPEDILSVTTFKLDEDGDGTYEETIATTDYVLYPLNDTPKTWAEISSNSEYGGFASGIKKGVEINGVFGYGDGKSASPYHDAGTDVNEGSGVTSTAVTITVDDGTQFAIAQTIRIDSEQIYIQSISTHVLTVKRGVNGTTAATHADDSDIDIYDYPEPIRTAVLIETTRLWKRKDEGFVTKVIGSSETGILKVYDKLDPYTVQVVGRYRRYV